jgi:hypothetical protein
MGIFGKSHERYSEIKDALTGAGATNGGGDVVGKKFAQVSEADRLRIMNDHVFNYGGEPEENDDYKTPARAEWMERNARPGESMADAAARITREQGGR